MHLFPLHLFINHPTPSPVLPLTFLSPVNSYSFSPASSLIILVPLPSQYLFNNHPTYTPLPVLALPALALTFPRINLTCQLLIILTPVVHTYSPVSTLTHSSYSFPARSLSLLCSFPLSNPFMFFLPILNFLCVFFFNKSFNSPSLRSLSFHYLFIFSLTFLSHAFPCLSFSSPHLFPYLFILSSPPLYLTLIFASFSPSHFSILPSICPPFYCSFLPFRFLPSSFFLFNNLSHPPSLFFLYSTSSLPLSYLLPIPHSSPFLPFPIPPLTLSLFLSLSYFSHFPSFSL